MAGALIDEDPELAWRHARAARSKGGRIGVVRETVGLVAYRAGEWAEAIAELRAARRMSGGPGQLPVLADCERALGHPEKAIELSRSVEAAELDPASAAELRIVVAGARADMGQLDAALAHLQTAVTADETQPHSGRMFYAYADLLLQAGRRKEAIDYFVKAAEMDPDDETDAGERLTELAMDSDAPDPSGMDSTGSVSTGPDLAGTDPAATDPAATDPTSTDPAHKDPSEIDPAATDPAEPDSAVIDPVDLVADFTERGSTEVTSGQAELPAQSGDMPSGATESTVDGGTVDTGTVGTGTVGTGTVGTGTVGTGTVGTGTVDTATVAGGTVDTAAVDGGTVDSGTVDGLANHTPAAEVADAEEDDQSRPDDYLPGQDLGPLFSHDGFGR